MASDVDIVLEVAVNGIQQIGDLSNALKQLNNSAQRATNPIKALDARSRALNNAVGASGKSLGNYAKSLSQLATNQAILSSEIAKSEKELKGLGTTYRFGTEASKQWSKAGVQGLRSYNAELKKIKARALTEDLKSVALEMKRTGKDMQFVGRSLIIGLTTPIAMGFRQALQSLTALDRETIRLTKVLEGVAPTADIALSKLNGITDPKAVQYMINNYETLNKKLLTTSARFGIARSLVTGLAADFSELGITNIDNIAAITDLTAATEKLGNMDISNAQDLVQSLYFQAVRVLAQSQPHLTAVERERKAIASATVQLNMFNMVENTTALTLKDLGDAFPEVAAAATTFGLSMTEAAAMLAPMKAAGFEVGASANSIKVSLQRMVAPTKANSEMMAQLSKQYGVHFEEVQGVGVNAVQALIDAYNTLNKTAGTSEESLKFFSKLFGVRQGPRMMVAFEQMAKFDKILKDTSKSSEELAEKKIQGIANSILGASKATLPLIKSYKDIAIVARIAAATIDKGQQTTLIQGFGAVTQAQIDAAREARKKIGKEIAAESQRATMEALKAGKKPPGDLISQIGTESGRALITQLAGPANAAAVAQQELERTLKGVDVQLSILKNNFKNFLTDLIKGITPAINKIADVSEKLYDKWSKLSPEVKHLASMFALITAGLTAAIGPMIFIAGQAKLAFGSVGRVLFSFLPGLNTMTIEALAGREAMLRLTNPLTVVGETIVNTNSKFATWIATLASGDTKIKNFAEKIGRLTGVLRETKTAPMPLIAALNEQKAVRGPGVLLGEGRDLITQQARVAKPTMPYLHKLSPGRIPVPDDVRIAHEAEVAKKAAEAYTKKYNETIQKLLAGRPLPLAGGAATTVRGRGAPGTGAGGRFISLPTNQPSITPTGMYRIPAGATGPQGQKFGGQFINWRKIQAQADAEASAYRARVESLENARMIRNLKQFNAERIQALRAGLDLKNKTAMEAFTKQLAIWKAEEEAARKHAMSMLRAEQQAKGITTKLGGRGTGQLIKERFFKGLKIEESQYESIMGGGLKGRKTAAGLTLKSFIPRSKDFGIKALGKAESASGKFIGGKTTFAAATGIATFVKNPIQTTKTMGTALATAFKNPSTMLTKFTGMFSKLGGLITGLLPTFSSLGSVLSFTGVGAAIALVIGTIIILVKNWKQFSKAIQPGIKAFQEAFSIIKDAVMAAIQPVFDFFAAFTSDGKNSNSIITGLAYAFNFVAEAVKFVAKIIGWLLKTVVGGAFRIALKPILALVRGIISFITGIVNIFQGKFKQGFFKILDGIGKAIVGLMGPFASLFSTILKMVGKVLGAMSKIPFVGGVFKKAADAVNAVAGYIDKAREMGKKDGGIKIKVKPDKPALDDAQEEIAQVVDDGMNAGAETGSKALAKKLKAYRKELIGELQEAIAERIKNAIESVVDGLTEGLKSQKEASLKVFDDQLKAIDDLQKAEEELTKTKEFENKKRELEEQRALNRSNYLRNKALAIYEGRIDDARQLSLENAKNEKDSNKSLSDLIADRDKDLANTARQNLIDQINQAKKEASDYFDDIIKKFQDAAKKITEFPPTTAQQFADQLALLAGSATTAANSMGTDLSTAFSGALANLGADASGPLTTALGTISTLLTTNNPFGPGGVWQTAIDESITALTSKYTNLYNTLTTIIDTKNTAFTKLFETFKKYKDLVASNEAETSGGGAGGGTGGGTGGGGGAGGGTGGGQTQVGKGGIVSPQAMAQVLMSGYRGSNGSTISSYLVSVLQYAKSKPVHPNGGAYAENVFKEFVAKYPDLSKKSNASMLSMIKTFYNRGIAGYGGYKLYSNGGMVPRFFNGGTVPGFSSQGFPAMLHGGEYVINSNAVRNIGIAALQSMNDMRFKTPTAPSAPSTGATTSTQNINVYVDNFIGEKTWFESMMKDYNLKVIPANQKAAGLEQRTITTYNGLNRGM